MRRHTVRQCHVSTRLDRVVIWYLNLDLGVQSSQLNTLPRVHASKPINTRDKETLSDMIPTTGKYT